MLTARSSAPSVRTVNTVYHRVSEKPAATSLRAILVLACGAQFMVVLDGLIVTVALPEMRSGLSLSASGQQWVINGYLVTCGGLLLLAARAADLLGHRRMFLAGLAVFTLASLAGGLAHDGSWLLTARVVQGVGAAALAPGSLSLLTLTHTGEDRARALAVWSATSGSAGALGLVLGGIITDALGWRWVLLINVPVGIVLWIAATKLLPRDHPADRMALDLPGAISVTLGISALVYGISQADAGGWGSTRVVVALVLFGALMLVFLGVERRSRNPLVPLAIFRRRNVVLANVVMVLLGVIMTATLFFLSLYQQRVLGYSPLRTGLSLLPMSVVITLGAIASKTLLPKLGPKRLLSGGALVMSAGLLLLATIPAHADYPAHVLAPTLVWAAGASIVTMPCVAIATKGIDPGMAGLASGLVNTSRQIGGAVGLASLSSIAGAASAHSASPNAGDQLVHGYGVALTVAAGVAFVVALIALQYRANDASS